MVLTRSQILAADDLPKTTVTVSEWGGDVTLQCLSGRDAYKWFEAGVKGVESMCDLIALCAIDDKGERLFTDKKDIAALAGKHPNALREVFDAALEICSLGASADKDAEKN